MELFAYDVYRDVTIKVVEQKGWFKSNKYFEESGLSCTLPKSILNLLNRMKNPELWEIKSGGLLYRDYVKDKEYDIGFRREGEEITYYTQSGNPFSFFQYIHMISDKGGDYCFSDFEIMSISIAFANLRKQINSSSILERIYE